MSQTPKNPVLGLHHITAIAGDPRQNLDFYTRVLGLRLVKRSVNQDAPDTYHLFYADAAGSPGADLTFFPWPRMDPARPGVGQATEVGFAVPKGSLAYWRERLEREGVTLEPLDRFGEAGVGLRDPHGFTLTLTESDDVLETTPWSQSPVPTEHQLRGFHLARMRVRELPATRRLLEDGLGFAAVGVEDGWHRFAVAGGGSGRLIEVLEDPEGRYGAWGTGGVHHLAFQVRDRAHELEVRARVAGLGAQPTDVIDRFWFQSVYFKEPGGVLFELATLGPGFAVDEDPEALGEKLILPPWLEPHRGRIEAALPPLD